MTDKPILIEEIAPNVANLVLEAEEGQDGKKKLRMEGIFMQGEMENHNGRNYPRREIASAVDELQKKIEQGYSVAGELDHPDTLTVNLSNISHVIDKMWMEGNNGMGRLTILPTPSGDIATALLNSGVKLGVSTRGSGDVNESSGSVSNFDIVTVDIVMQPSAGDAYPTPIYESVFGSRTGRATLDVFQANRDGDKTAEKFIEAQVTEFIKSLKW